MMFANSFLVDLARAVENEWSLLILERSEGRSVQRQLAETILLLRHPGRTREDTGPHPGVTATARKGGCSRCYIAYGAVSACPQRSREMLYSCSA
jgi:hypothetical protein